MDIVSFLVSNHLNLPHIFKALHESLCIKLDTHFPKPLVNTILQSHFKLGHHDPDKLRPWQAETLDLLPCWWQMKPQLKSSFQGGQCHQHDIPRRVQRSATAAAQPCRTAWENVVLSTAQRPLLPTPSPAFLGMLWTTQSLLDKFLFCLNHSKFASVPVTKNPTESNWALPLINRLTGSPKHSGIN